MSILLRFEVQISPVMKGNSHEPRIVLSPGRSVLWPSFYRNEGQKESGNSYKVAQPLAGRARIQIQPKRIQSPWTWSQTKNIQLSTMPSPERPGGHTWTDLIGTPLCHPIRKILWTIRNSMAGTIFEDLQPNIILITIKNSTVGWRFLRQFIFYI